MAVRVKGGSGSLAANGWHGLRVQVRNGTWNGGGLWRGLEGQDSRFRFASQVFGHNGDVIVRVPFQIPQDNVLTAIGQAELWLPVLAKLLQIHRSRLVIGGPMHSDLNNSAVEMVCYLMSHHTHRFVAHKIVFNGRAPIVLLDQVDLHLVAWGLWSSLEFGRIGFPWGENGQKSGVRDSNTD